MKLLEGSLKLTTGLSIFLVGVFALMTAVTWLAARSTIVLLAPIVLSVLAGLAGLVGLVGTLAYITERGEWLATRRAEAKRDRAIAWNEAKRANVEYNREYTRMVGEAKLMNATVEMVKSGMIHPVFLGDGKFSSFPAQGINQIESQVSPAPQLPAQIDLAQLIPTGPSLNALALGIEATETTLQPLTSSLVSLVHVGVGGSSGWGKSVFLQCLAIQIALAPETAQMAMIDIEGQTFSPFAALGRDRLRYPLADNENDIMAILDDLGGEWERRRQLFQQYPTADSLTSYNDLADEQLPPIVMMIDEINMLTDDKAIMGQLTRLGQGTRKYGLFCVIGGQDWNAASIPTKLRNNFSTRIQLKAMSKVQSRVMIEDSAAADIKDAGRAYAVLPGRSVIEIQTPFISKADIARALTGIAPAPAPTSAPSNENRIESLIVADYQANGSYSKAFRLLHELENGAAYDKGIGGNQTAKVKEILDRHGITHPL